MKLVYNFGKFGMNAVAATMIHAGMVDKAFSTAKGGLSCWLV